MRTALGKVRGRGSARSGTEHFWQQRLTAIANVPLTMFVVGFIVTHLGAARADVIASLHNPIAAIAMGLAVISMLWHMRLGLQVVIEDYVHAEGWKLALILANTFFVLLMGAAALFSILKMSIV
jgi:succinate dehydrogenase / fumarate reductase, membrane anchor subunit